MGMFCLANGNIGFNFNDRTPMMVGPPPSGWLVTACMELCTCPDIAPDDVETVIPARAQCPLNIGEDDIEAANLPIPQQCPAPNPVAKEKGLAHCNEYWYGRPEKGDCLAALAKMNMLAQGHEAFLHQSTMASTRLLAKIDSLRVSALNLRLVKNLPIIVTKGTCTIALVETDGRTDPPNTKRVAGWKTHATPRMENVIKSCVEPHGIGGWREFGTWETTTPQGMVYQLGLKETGIYVYGPKSKQEDLMNMKYSCSVDAAGVAGCNKVQDYEPPTKKPKTSGDYSNEGAGDAGQGTSQDPGPSTAQRPAGTSCSANQDCDISNDYLCLRQKPHIGDESIHSSWESFVCKYAPETSSDRSAAITLGSACRGRCMLANVTYTNITTTNANTTTLQILPRPNMPLLKMGYQCACNCTYVSAGCCLSNDGIVWEDPAAKAPLMVQPPNATTCCDGTTGRFKDPAPILPSNATTKRDLSLMCARTPG